MIIIKHKTLTLLWEFFFYIKNKFSLKIYVFVTNIIDWVIELIYLFTLIVDILHIHENNK